MKRDVVLLNAVTGEEIGVVDISTFTRLPMIGEYLAGKEDILYTVEKVLHAVDKNVLFLSRD